MSSEKKKHPDAGQKSVQEWLLMLPLSNMNADLEALSVWE